MGTVMMKNWEPFVEGPEFWGLFVRGKRGGEGGKGEEGTHTAMLKIPGASCLRMKFSSANDLVP